MNTTYAGTFVVLVCCNCGITFGIEPDYQRELKKSHQRFYCPNGHKQYYASQTEEERLADALTRERAEHDQTRAALNDKERARLHHERRARVLKGHHTRLKRRVAHGVCPCCNRSFQNLARHMSGQHPSYVEGVPA